jgi:outer membrane immunogenic protein
MKSLKAATALLLLTSASAVAADLPSIKSAPATAPAPMWTGFYAGLNVGYGFNTSNSITTSGVPYDPWAEQQAFFSTTRWSERSQAFSAANSSSFSISQAGVLGGGQIGYNYLYKDRYLVGIETDFQGSGISGSGSQYSIVSDELYYINTVEASKRDTIGGGAVSAGVDWFGTVRGRLGYLITPSLLAYGTGGLTYGGVHASVTPSAYSAFSLRYNRTLTPYGGSLATSFPGSQNSVLVGWNAGGGFEWMFLSNWSVKAEAIYYNLGSETVSNQLATQTAKYRLIGGVESGWALFSNTKINYAGIIARMGVNYHFNFASAPVVAKF